MAGFHLSVFGAIGRGGRRSPAGGTAIGAWSPLLLIPLLLLLVATSKCIWRASPPAIMTPFLLLSWLEIPSSGASKVCITHSLGQTGSRLYLCTRRHLVVFQENIKVTLPAAVQPRRGAEILPELERCRQLWFPPLKAVLNKKTPSSQVQQSTAVLQRLLQAVSKAC